MRRFLAGVFSITLGMSFAVSDLSRVNAQETSAEEFTLEEITVTAQKREENQQKVAIAMEVVNGEEIKELGKNDIDEILSTISSVMINTGTDGLRVSIRGMSNDNPVFNNMQASTPTVAVNQDGIYTNRNNSNQDLYDVERVEVLFGPQSTMYASASPGGIVNVVTSSPKTDRYEASGTLEYGNYNLLHTEGSVNAPVNDKIAFRAAFTTSTHDGYLSNGANDEDTKSGRLKALYQPSDSLSFVIIGELSKSIGQGFSGVESFIEQDGYYEDGTKVTDPWTSEADISGLSTSRDSKEISGRMDLDLGYAGALSVVASHTETTNYSAGITETMGDQTEQTNEGSGDENGIEVRMVSSSDFPFKWILGVNAYKAKEEQDTTSVQQGVDDPQTNIGNRDNEQKTFAVYGNITYPLTDNFRVTAGMRQTWDKNNAHNYEEPGKADAEYTYESSLQEYKDPTYKLGFEYDIGTDSMVYSNWSTSYRTQGMSFSESGEMFPPEELTAYTIGSKNRFWGNKLQLNLSAYDYEYKNYSGAVGSIMMTIRDDNGNGHLDEGEDTLIEDDGTKQIGDARIYGLDLQSNMIITNHDKLDFSVSYIKKKFTHLVFDFTDITNEIGVPDVDYSGKEMALAPHWTLNATYNHNFTLKNGGVITSRFEARYQSKYSINWQALTASWEENDDGTYDVTIEDTSAIRFQEPYHIENVSLIYANPDGKWTLTGYVKNIANYAVKRSMMMTSMMIGDPRTYGGVLSVRF